MKAHSSILALAVLVLALQECHGAPVQKRRKQKKGTGGATTSLDALLEAAIEKAEGGDLEGALVMFQELADSDPQNGRSWENLGVTQLRLQVVI